MIDTIEALRKLYEPPGERALRKELPRLDRHCLRFIELSPFFVLATSGADGRLDASPRGGPPGFVKPVGDTTLVIPDLSGNNRLDSLENIVETRRAGLLFLIPGIDETLRVNGGAIVTTDPERLELVAAARGTPRAVIEVTVEEAYLHCAKAFMRSRLWAEASRRERSVLPTLGEILKDQLRSDGPAETQEQMLARYARDL